MLQAWCPHSFYDKFLRVSNLNRARDLHTIHVTETQSRPSQRVGIKAETHERKRLSAKWLSWRF